MKYSMMYDNFVTFDININRLIYEFSWFNAVMPFNTKNSHKKL